LPEQESFASDNMEEETGQGRVVLLYFTMDSSPINTMNACELHDSDYLLGNNALVV